MKKVSRQLNSGSVLVSALLSITLLALIATGVIGVLFISSEGVVRSGMHQRALAVADEGMEAVRSIRDADFSELASGTYGLEISDGEWQLTNSAMDVNNLSRSVEITELDSDTREVAVTVNWDGISGQNKEIALTSRLTNWQASAAGSPDCSGPPQDRPPECDDNNDGGSPGGGGPPEGGPPGQQ